MNIKKILILSCYSELNLNDRLINSVEAPIGDNLLLPFLNLNSELQKYDVELTSTYLPDEYYNSVILIDMPRIEQRAFLNRKKIGKLYLLNLESPIYCKIEDIVCNAHEFDCVFTYNDILVEKYNFTKINYSFQCDNIKLPIAKKNKLITFIASNKASKQAKTFYKNRNLLISDLQKYFGNQFDLYGHGWDTYLPNKYSPVRIFNKFPAIRTAIAKLFYPSYRGCVRRKSDVLKNYKFCIAYENYSEFGYITEKIFDCFFANTIPIYYGAPNIREYIPENCYIDGTKFISNIELSNYIRSITENQCIQYRNNIQEFLSSQSFQNFNVRNFTKTIIKELLEKNSVCQ